MADQGLFSDIDPDKIDRSGADSEAITFGDAATTEQLGAPGPSVGDTTGDATTKGFDPATGVMVDTSPLASPRTRERVNEYLGTSPEEDVEAQGRLDAAARSFGSADPEPTGEFFPAEGQTGKPPLAVRGLAAIVDSGRDRAAAAGVLFDKPLSTHSNFLASFAVNDKEAVRAFRKGMQRDGQEPILRLGPQTDAVEYFDSETSRFALARGGRGRLAGPAIAIAPEIATGLAMTLIQKVPGAGVWRQIAGSGKMSGAEGIAAGLGEVVRIGIGYGLGINQPKDVTNEEYAIAIAKASGIAMAGGFAGDTLIRTAVGVKHLLEGVAPADMRFLGKKLELSEQEHAVAIRVTNEINDRLKVIGATERLSLNPAQKTLDEELLAVQEVFRRDPAYAQEFGDFTDAQAAALDTFYKDLQGFSRDILTGKPGAQAGAPLAAGVTPPRGQSISETEQSIADSMTRAMNEDPVVREADRAYQVADKDFREAFGGVEGYSLDGADFGEIIQRAGTEVEAAFLANADSLVKQIDTLAGQSGKFIQTSNFARKVAELNAKNDGVVLPGLQRSLRSLLGPERVDGPAGNPVLTPAFNRNTRLGMQDAWETLKALRAQARVASKGLTTDTPQAGIYKILQNELEKDMNIAMTMHKSRRGIKLLWDEFNTTYAYNKNLLDESIFGKILKREGPGTDAEFSMTSDDAFALLFKGGRGTKRNNVMSVLRLLDGRPEDASKFRQALAGHYETRVMTVDPKTGVPGVNLAEHKKFHDEFSDVFSAMGFSHAERRMLKDPGNTAKRLYSTERRLQEARESMLPDYGDITKPQQLFSKLWNDSNDPARLDKFMKALDKLPPGVAAPILRGFRYHALKQMNNAITVQRGGVRVLDANALSRYVDGKAIDGTVADGKGHRALLERTMGPEYMKGLESLTDALRRTSARVKDPNFSNTAFWTKTVTGLSRAYLGMFTRPGRFVTAAAQIRGAAANRALVRALTNESDMLEMVKIMNLDMRNARVMNFMTAAGASAWYTFPDGTGQDGREELKNYYTNRRVPQQ